MAEKRVRVELTFEGRYPADDLELAAVAEELRAQLSEAQLAMMEALAAAILGQRVRLSRQLERLLNRSRGTDRDSGRP